MRRLIALLATALLPPVVAAQPEQAWQACTAIVDGAQRLACFDAWAQRQGPAAPAAVAPLPEAGTLPAPAGPGQASMPTATALATVPPALPQVRRGLSLTASEGCRDTRYSELSRFWELE